MWPAISTFWKLRKSARRYDGRAQQRLRVASVAGALHYLIGDEHVGAVRLEFPHERAHEQRMYCGISDLAADMHLDGRPFALYGGLQLHGVDEPFKARGQRFIRVIFSECDG